MRNMSDTEQQEAPVRVDKYNCGEVCATPVTAATFCWVEAGIQMDAGLPINRAVSALVSEPWGTTTMSAPRRSRARRRLVSAPRMIRVVPTVKAARMKAHRPITQLR